MRVLMRLIVVFAILLGASCAKPENLDLDPRYAKPEEVWSQLPGKRAWLRLGFANATGDFIPAANYRIYGRSLRRGLSDEIVLPKAGDRIIIWSPAPLVVVNFETQRDEPLLYPSLPSLEYAEIPVQDRVAVLMPETPLLIQAVIGLQEARDRGRLTSVWALVSPGG